MGQTYSMTSTSGKDGFAIIIVAVILMLFSIAMSFVHFYGYFKFNDVTVDSSQGYDIITEAAQAGGAAIDTVKKGWNSCLDSASTYAKSRTIHLVSGISYLFFAMFSAWMIWAGRKIKGYYA